MYTSANGGRSKETKTRGWEEERGSTVLSELCGRTILKTGGRGIM